MRSFLDKLASVTRPPYVRWPLLLVFAVTLPWTILIIPIYGANDFTYSQLNTWLILSVVAIGLNLLTGLTGMISLGHSAVFAVGAFGTGYFVSKLQLPFVAAIILAAILAGILGLILGLPALRLSGPYLAVATFVFAVAVPQLLFTDQVNSIFSDPNDVTTTPGVFKVAKQTLPGLDARSDLGRYYMFLIIAAVMILLAMGLWRSRTGRAFRAIRDSETAAQAMGINIARYKVLAFIISSMFAGVAGSMYMAQLGQLDAHNLEFSAIESILFLTAIILGGLGSIWGSILGVAILTALPNVTSALNQFFSDTFGYKIENFESIFYGLIIILCVFYMPNGLVGAFKSLVARLRGVPVEKASSEMRPDKAALPAENDLPIGDEILAQPGKGA